MLCNFCGKTLDICDEANLGNLTIRFFYGSKRDEDQMNFSICSDCVDKLTDEFISRCKHKPKIISAYPDVPEWEAKSTEEVDY
jgi:hypothetical protein